MSTDTNQRLLLREFLSAQKNGFVEKIDIEVHTDAGKIMYDPDTTMYRTEWDWIDVSPVRPVTPQDALDDFPEYKMLCIKFKDTVRQDAISQIAEYVKKRYSCKCTVYSGRLDVYGI